MIPVSAAAARPEGDSRIPDLQGRLHGFLERPPHHNGERLAERLLPTQLSETSDSQDGRFHGQNFHWLLTAEWLAESFGVSATQSGRALLADLCWIQYCIYGLFRAQDDLVDGEVEDPMLAVEANQLLVEAAASAARHFDGTSPFWDVFRNTIDATSRAMTRLERIQATPDRAPHVELDLYIDLGACLKIAAAGVAFAAGQEEAWEQQVSPALDRVVVAGQILDDLHDIEEDLAEGRINYAAWFLGRPVFGSTSEAIAAVVASNLATTNRLEALVALMRELLDEAATLVSPDTCARTHAYLTDYGLGISALGREIEASRSALFAGAHNAA